MMIKSKNNKNISLKRLQEQDYNLLCDYLFHLSAETKKRFGPHPFDKDSISTFYKASNLHWGYIAVDPAANQIIAYAIIKLGFLDHDAARLQAYDLTLDQYTDCTFAPSIADDWQSQGLGYELLKLIIKDLKQHTDIKRMILWGGVQADNFKAVKFYENNGFKMLGSFNYNGENFDMLKEL